MGNWLLSTNALVRLPHNLPRAWLHRGSDRNRSCLRWQTRRILDSQRPSPPACGAAVNRCDSNQYLPGLRFHKRRNNPLVEHGVRGHDAETAAQQLPLRQWCDSHIHQRQVGEPRRFG